MKALILKICAPAVWGLGNSQPRLLDAYLNGQKDKKKNEGNVNYSYFNSIKLPL